MILDAMHFGRLHMIGYYFIWLKAFDPPERLIEIGVLEPIIIKEIKND